MPKEFEAKFLDVDVNQMRNKLKEIGATLIHKKDEIHKISISSML